MWDRGKFGSMLTENKTALYDPWAVSDRRNTPFDQEFYLILNVAVGGTNGYWPDTVGNKPWADGQFAKRSFACETLTDIFILRLAGSDTAQLEFWKAKSQWLPTWGKGAARGMTVKQVKMFKQGKC
jgi:hypothetical protein